MNGKEIPDEFTKARVREMVRERLAGLPEEGRSSASATISRHLGGLEEVKGARHLLAYYPLADEPDLLPLLQACACELYLPAFDGGTPVIRRTPSLDALKRGYRGIPEPDGPAVTASDEIAVCLVPGRAFANDGTRLGRGGGHYDRILASLPGRCLKIGVAFECQIFERLPREPHDIPVGCIVTESRVLKLSTGA